MQIDQAELYRAAQTRKLVAWIDSHDRPEPTVVNPDGTLTVATVAIKDGKAFIEYDVIAATLSAARDLLGY